MDIQLTELNKLVNEDILVDENIKSTSTNKSLDLLVNEHFIFSNKNIKSTSTNKSLDLLVNEHFRVFSAIVLWRDVLNKITDYKIDEKYEYLIANANALVNQNMANDINQVIGDFYKYFYTEKNICNMNYNRYNLLTNNYINLFDLITPIPTKDKNILRDITFYVFDLIILYRNILKLPIFENNKYDEYLVKYYTEYIDNKSETIINTDNNTANL